MAMAERASLPLLPHPAIWMLTVLVTTGTAFLSLGLFCILSLSLSSLLTAVGVEFGFYAFMAVLWLSCLPVTLVGSLLMQTDILNVGSLVDASASWLGLCWAEYERGSGLTFAGRVKPPAPAEGAPDLGGFETRHRDRSWLIRDLSRALAGGLCSAVAIGALGVGFWWIAEGNATLTMVLGFLVGPYLLFSILPIAGGVAAWRSWWQTRRGLDWSDRVTLEGNVLRTDQGDFHFRSDWEARIERDGYGTVFYLSDAQQQLRFRAPWADLLWIEEQLAAVRLAEGDAQEVPQELRDLTREAR